MKKTLLYLLSAGIFAISCSKDEEAEAARCLVCEGNTTDESITADDGVCVGLMDDEGNTLTLEQLEATRDILVAFGATCTIQ